MQPPSRGRATIFSAMPSSAPTACSEVIGESVHDTTMNADLDKQRINQYLAEAPELSPRIACGEPRRLGRKLMFATSDPQGRAYFVGIWAIYDPETERIW